MKLYITYELSPFTSGGVGTYMQHIVLEACRTRTPIALLMGVEISMVNTIRTSFQQSGIAEYVTVYSAYEFAWLRPATNVYLQRSLFFCEAMASLVRLHRFEYIEFFDYCGPAYHLLCERAGNSHFRNTTIAVRFHNTIQVIDRFAGRAQSDKDSPYALEQYCISNCDRLIVPGRNFWESVRALYNIPHERVVQITPPYTHSLLPRLHKRQDGVVFVGRPSLIKGFDTFYKALLHYDQLSSAAPLPDISIVGPPETVAGEVNPEDLISSARITARVRLLGKLSPEELRDTIGSFDIAVFPNRTESYCYALHEALLSGCRLLVNAIPAFRDHLAENSDIRFFDGTPEDLASTLTDMLTCGPMSQGRELITLRDRYVDREYSSLVPLSKESSPSDLRTAMLICAADCAEQKAWSFARLAKQATGNDTITVADNSSEAGMLTAMTDLLDSCGPDVQQYLVITVCRDGATADHLARALAHLASAATTECVVIASSIPDADFVYFNQQIPLPDYMSTPTAIIWRLRNRSAVYDHIAKSFHLLNNANVIRSVADTYFIGTGDHPFAKQCAAPLDSYAISLSRVATTNALSLHDVDLRLRTASAVVNNRFILFVINGHLAYSIVPDVNPLFGFTPSGAAAQESSFGALEVPLSCPNLQLSVLSSTAEVWLYVNGQRTGTLLAEGSTHCSVDSPSGTPQFRSLCAALSPSAKRSSSLRRSPDGHLVVATASAKETLLARASDSELVVATTVEDAFVTIQSNCAKTNRLVLTTHDLSAANCDVFSSLRHFQSPVALDLVIRNGFFYSHDYQAHFMLALLGILSVDIETVTLVVHAPPHMSTCLRELGYVVDELPEQEEASSFRLPSAVKPPLRILLSSTGAYAGMYGHSICAIGLALPTTLEIPYLVDIVSPSEQSRQLLKDLGLAINASEISEAKASAQAELYHLVIEPYPDGSLSDSATKAITAGATAVVCGALREPFVNHEHLIFTDEWEAADRISELLTHAFASLSLRSHDV